MEAVTRLSTLSEAKILEQSSLPVMVLIGSGAVQELASADRGLGQPSHVRPMSRQVCLIPYACAFVKLRRQNVVREICAR